MAGNWIHKLLNPHCPDCKEERDNSRVCPSCETLKMQLEISNNEKRQLLERILEKPALESKPELREVTRPVNVPWRVRQQMLEAEDREKARLMREAPKPVSTEDLEKDLDIASATREAES
jgi:uncharacterized Zn finger protein (UPF0148 family)